MALYNHDDEPARFNLISAFNELVGKLDHGSGEVVQGGRLAGLRHAELKVLLVLMKFADKNAVAWPSVPTIAQLCGTTNHPHIRNTLSALQSKGLVEIVAKGGGRAKSTRRRVLLGNGYASRTPLEERGTSETGKGYVRNDKGVRTKQATGTTVVPRSSSSNPSKNNPHDPHRMDSCRAGEGKGIAAFAELDAAVALAARGVSKTAARRFVQKVGESEAWRLIGILKDKRAKGEAIKSRKGFLRWAVAAANDYAAWSQLEEQERSKHSKAAWRRLVTDAQHAEQRRLAKEDSLEVVTRRERSAARSDVAVVYDDVPESQQLPGRKNGTKPKHKRKSKRPILRPADDAPLQEWDHYLRDNT